MIRVTITDPRLAPYGRGTPRAIKRQRVAREKACRYLLHLWRMQDAQWHAITRRVGLLNAPLYMSRSTLPVVALEPWKAEAHARAECMTTDVDWTPDGKIDPAFAATLQRLATRTDDEAVMAFHVGPTIGTPREVQAAATLRCPKCGATFDAFPEVGDVHLVDGACAICGTTVLA